MEIKLLGRERRRAGFWAGGKTREIAIFPEDADYKKGDFLFRICSARSSEGEADFTCLPDYKRTIVLTEGEGLIKNNSTGERAFLKPYDKYEFNGSDNMSLKGSSYSFNLITRKDAAEGNIEYLDICGPVKYSFGEDEFVTVYCAEGQALVYMDEGIRLIPGEGILAKGEGKIILDGIGKMIFASVKVL